MTTLEQQIHLAVYDLTAKLVYLFGKYTVEQLEGVAEGPRRRKGRKAG